MHDRNLERANRRSGQIRRDGFFKMNPKYQDNAQLPGYRCLKQKHLCRERIRVRLTKIVKEADEFKTVIAV